MLKFPYYALLNITFHIVLFLNLKVCKV